MAREGDLSMEERSSIKIECKNVSKHFDGENGRADVLDNISLQVISQFYFYSLNLP